MDYINGFRLTFENAKRLFNSAEELETSKEFPIANSLLILAAEEGIKAYAVLMQYLSPEKTLNGFKRAFKDHKYKLNFIRIIVLFSKIFQKFEELYFYPMLHNIGKSQEEIAKIKSQNFNNLLNWFKNESDLKKTDLSEQMEWWKHAKAMKENGFYVGYNNEKWTIPSSIRKEQYLKTKKFVGDFLKQLETIYNCDLNDESILELFDEIKQKIGETK